MKIKTRICDMCGETVYLHGRSAYQITKHKWEVDFFPKKIDLCERCYYNMKAFIERYNLDEGDSDGSSGT